MNNLKKIHILVIAGGWSDERSVSLSSGRNVYQTLKSRKLKVSFFDLKKNNLDQIIKYKPDIIFNALHGEFGEDGGLSCLASKYSIPITHSNDLTSALCFNKRLLKHFLKKKLNVLSPNEGTLNSSLPVIAKPNWGGSSNGISFIKNKKLLKKTLNQNNILIEEVIKGRELTVTVLRDGNKIKALGITEIAYEGNIYNYEAKYTKGKSKHFFPARIPIKDYKAITKISEKIFKTCNCQSIARLDFIYSDINKKFYFLEINTHPGLTKISLAPEQAHFNKISYFNLIKKILISSYK